MPQHRIFTTAFSKVYPLYVKKAQNKQRTQQEVDHLICWLTGYTEEALQAQILSEKTFIEFFDQAPKMHPNIHLITGVVCGVRVEEVADPLMQKIRYLDKLVDELAKGKPLDKIKR
ncbi:DUF2200 domain-containing protein [Undibacterium fentianense]|uniref:DUF2200 domain-containing protein n=1 Tax=Undibacterium fentianense TaxID=2828728 RepID=A0A941E6A8_9BURK|nr:DUF2200 domain-containing protein [Undibacterium fentianense]MBR7801359.1 DUF2200 domain-containing protein [Undibacterium fentianense]